MPRELTDLMERATSFAPPEPHAAGDITRLAARRLQRRTTTLLAGAAAVAVVAAGLAYGVTRHDTTPEPAGPYKYDQQRTVKDVVAADALPGYRLEPWHVPSIQDMTDQHISNVHTYLGIDPSGRLLVQTVPPSDPAGQTTVKVYDAPGDTPSGLRQPPPVGENLGKPIQWLPSLTEDDRLIWRATVQTGGKRDGYHITDLSGGNDVFVPTSGLGPVGDGVSRVWVSGEQIWFLTVQSTDQQGGIYYDLRRSSLAHPGDQSVVARQVVLADVRDGVAGWMTKGGRVYTESGQAGAAREVSVPYDRGCRMPRPALLNLTDAFAVGDSTVALTERCRPGHEDEANELVAFSTTGRLLMHLSGVSVFSLAMGGGSLTFGGIAPVDGKYRLMHYDLRTGVLSSLPYQGAKAPDVAPDAAGDYVLWYDAGGGHVARIPQ